MGKKGKRYSPRFQFQVVLEVLKGDREAVGMARAYNVHAGHSLVCARPNRNLLVIQKRRRYTGGDSRLRGIE